MNTHITHKKLFKNGLLFGALLLGLGLSIKEATPAKAVTANFNGPVYRLYNPNSGEHLYTTSNYEVNQLKNYGWVNEGVVFYDASHYGSRQAIGIIRLYNPNSGQHFYTNNSEEAASLIKVGWNDEYTAFVFSSPLPPQSGSVSPD